MNQTPAVPGIKGLPPKRAAEKLGRRKSWLWARLKSDPEFPRPVYLAPKAPVFIEAELDAYMAKLAAARAKPHALAA